MSGSRTARRPVQRGPAQAAAPLLRQTVRDKIRDAILQGRYAPNSVLSENELAAEYGISRTPVREALRELAVRGLIRVLPKRGIIVTELSPRDVLDLYQLREALECAAVRVATELMDEDDARGFREDQAETEALLASGNYLATYDSSIRMHSRILDIAGNARIKQIIRELSDQVHRIGMMTLRHGRSETSIAEHAQIIAAMIAGDADRAESLMRAHLVSDRDVVLNQILGVSPRELKGSRRD